MGNAGGKWLVIFPLLLLLTPLLHAQTANPCASCGMTNLYIEYLEEDAALGAVLSATYVNFSQERDVDQLRNVQDISPTSSPTVEVIAVP
jgi:hypothetical protein